MELDLRNMSSLELEVLEQNLQGKLDVKLRNMKYDEELNNLYADLEEVLEEKRRRKQDNG